MPAEFQKGGREIRVKVEGQLVFNGTGPMLMGIVRFGLAYVPENTVQAHIAAGRLIRVLPIGVLPIPGITLDHPAAANPRQHSHCWSLHCATGVEAGKIEQCCTGCGVAWER